jgi:hypothetical protein
LVHSSSSDEADKTVLERKKHYSPLKEDPPAGDSDDEVEFLYEQNFYQIREECLKEKRLFEDPEFPADNDLIRARSGRDGR